MVLFYLLSLVACLIFCRRVWRALPFFTLSVFVVTIFEFAYQPYSGPWREQWYALLIWPVFVTRAMAVAEGAYVHLEFLPKKWIVYITATAFGLLAAAIVAWNMHAANVVRAGQYRRVAMIGMTGFIAAYILLLWSAGQWRSGIAGRHVLFLLAICLSFTVPILLNMVYPGQLWWTVDPIAYGARTLIYLLWCLSISIPDRQPCRTTPGLTA